MSDTNEKDFNNKWHIDARPQFHVMSGENMARANRALGDIGNFIQKDCAPDALRELEYLGSMSCHAYMGHTGVVIISQTAPLGTINEPFALKMKQRLEADLKVHYGHERTKATRSGL